MSSSYAGTAQGTGLDLSVAAGGQDLLGLQVGTSQADVTSSPLASGEAVGILLDVGGSTVLSTQASTSTSGPSEVTDSDSIADQTVPVGDLLTLSVALAKAESASVGGAAPSSTSGGSLLDLGLEVDAAVVAADVGVSAVASDSSVAFAGTALTAGAGSHLVEIPITVTLGALQEINEAVQVCDLLGGVDDQLPGGPLGLRETCTELVNTVETSATTELAVIRILPAAAQCVVDIATGAADVPVLKAALVQIELLGEEVISLEPNQTIDLLEGTPLHIHAEAGTTAKSVGKGSASAIATAVKLGLFEGGDLLPSVVLTASESSCAVEGGQVFEERVAPPLPVTGAPLGAIYLGGGALVAGAVALRRFLKRA